MPEKVLFCYDQIKLSFSCVRVRGWKYFLPLLPIRITFKLVISVLVISNRLAIVVLVFEFLNQKFSRRCNLLERKRRPLELNNKWCSQ